MNAASTTILKEDGKKRANKKKELVETTISIRTKYLSKEVKVLCDFNLLGSNSPQLAA